MLSAAVLFVGACGDDDGGATPATTVAPTVAADPDATAEPSFSATVEGLVGFEGKIVVGVLLPTAGGSPQGFVCLPIDADPWTGTGIFTTSAPDNPCDKEPPYGETIDSAGEYSLMLGVYTPGESAPEVCLETVATLFGPSSVTVGGASLVPDCTG